MAKDVQLEGRVPDSQLIPTWQEYLTPAIGAVQYLARVQVATKNLNSQTQSHEWAKCYLRAYWNILKLAICHTAEVVAATETISYFSR